MKKLILVLGLVFCCGRVLADEGLNVPATDALQQLKCGNGRFTTLQMVHPDISIDRRNQLVSAQHPFAVVISCSDSRVAPEVIFDQGLGDIFVIRNAGNTFDEHVMGSVEYAVEHLGVNLVVVLGHGSCGAVAATMGNAKGSKYIKSIEKSIKPAIKEAEKEKCLCAPCVTKDNAILVSQELLKRSHVLKEAIEERGLKVVPAYYHLDSGAVEFLSQ